MSRKQLATASILLLSFVTGYGCATEAVESANDKTFALNYLSDSPHSTEHFTQGLFFFNGRLYESVGQYGESALIKYQEDHQTPSVQRKLTAQYFAEGATNHKDVIYQLTWREKTAFAYRGAFLTASTGFQYETEGWGLTSDGDALWLSDGSDKIKRIDETGQILGEITVSLGEQTLDRLNELEWINGWIFANRWYDPRIYVINPESGDVVYAFDLSELTAREMQQSRDNVLNGIAWNPDTQVLWVTGKNWSRFYQFKLQTPQWPP